MLKVHLFVIVFPKSLKSVVMARPPCSSSLRQFSSTTITKRWFGVEHVLALSWITSGNLHHKCRKAPLYRTVYIFGFSPLPWIDEIEFFTVIGMPSFVIFVLYLSLKIKICWNAFFTYFRHTCVWLIPLIILFSLFQI